MPNYNHTTLLVFRTSLKEALDSDTTVTNFWPDAELNIIIQEALLTFNAIAGFQKEEIFIDTISGQRLYNIFLDQVNDIKAIPTITYGDIIKWLNADLIENISVATPTSNLFSLAELLDLIDAKYNVFQLETNAVISKTTLNVLAQNNLVKLPDNILDLVRLKYNYSVDGTNYEVILQREDEETISNYDADALTEEGVPIYYSTVYGSPNLIKLYPIPNLTGTLEVLYVGTRDTSIPLTVDTIINLPNSLAIYLKYHALQDIFNKDGLLNDPARAKYCEARWNEGLIIGKNYSTILTVKANGIPISTDSLNKLDDYTDILSPTSDAPTILGLAGLNIFEIDTLPNADINSISAIVNSNIPLPVLDNDYIDIEIGYIDLLQNYCIHLCQFKCGATELSATNSYMSDFVKLCLVHNKRLINKGISYETLIGRTKLEEKQIPRLVEQQVSQQQPQQQQ